MNELVLENRQLRLAALPELGGKLASLVCRRTGRELLLPPQRPRRQPVYGASFADYDTSGWDECFPNVGVCQDLPDHGELWSRPWTTLERTADAWTAELEGRARSYRFLRRIQLRDHGLRFDYQLTNTEGRAWPCLWSAHPLLAVGPGDRIEPGPEVAEVRVEWSARGRLQGTVPWNEELAVLRGDVERAEKLFTRSDRARLHYTTGEALEMRWDASQNPYLGLWICQRGWPAPGPEGHFTVALEPCSFPADVPGDEALLQPGEVRNWWLEVEVC